MENKLTIMNRFSFHTSNRNITHLAVLARRTNKKIDILKGGMEVEKSQISNFENNFNRKTTRKTKKSNFSIFYIFISSD